MGYFNNSQSTILGLKNLNTGNQLKAGDKTKLKYKLTDANDDILDLRGAVADIHLLQGSVAKVLTTTIVNDNLEVVFGIDTVLEPGSYQLEIVINDQFFFPGDNSENIIVYPSYLSLIQDVIDDSTDMTAEDLKEFILAAVKNGLDAYQDKDTTYVAGKNIVINDDNVISSIDQELHDLVATKQTALIPGTNITIDAEGNISATDTLYDDTDLRNEIDGKQDPLTAGDNVTINATGVISATDTNTVYDETALRELVESKQDQLTAGDNVAIDADGVISATDTVYDDTALRSVVEGKQATLTAGTNVLIDENGVISATDTNTVYDDTLLQAAVNGKQAALAAGENITIDAENRISAVDTVYDDSTIRVKLGDINKAIDSLVAGDIDMQGFIDRLTTLETDMLLVKQKTTQLSTNVGNLQSIVDNIGEVDLAEVNSALGAIREEILDLRDELGDTTLMTQVDNLETTVANLTNVVNELIANGGDSTEIDPVALTQLQEQVDTLSAHVDSIATEYNIDTLIARVEDIENLTYHFEGTSEDVKQFVEDNSVRALRFHSEYNLLLSSVKGYGAAYNDMNNFLSGEWGSFQRSAPANVRTGLVQYMFNEQLLSSLSLLGKTIAIRVNPSYGFIDDNGNLISSDLYFSVVLENIIDESGVTYTSQLNFGIDDVIDGQVNVYIPESITMLRIAFGALNNSVIDSNLPPGKTVVDEQYLGIWVIEEPEPEEPTDPDPDDGTAPNDPADFELSDVTFTVGTPAYDAVESVKDAIPNAYTGDKTISAVFPGAYASEWFNAPGTFELLFDVIFDNNTDIQLAVPVIIIEDGTAPTDPGDATEHPFIGYHIEMTSDETRTDNKLYLQVPTIEEGEELVVTLDEVQAAINEYGPEDERLYEFQEFVDKMTSPRPTTVKPEHTLENARSAGMFGGTDLETGYTTMTEIKYYH